MPTPRITTVSIGFLPFCQKAIRETTTAKGYIILNSIYSEVNQTDYVLDANVLVGIPFL